MSSSNRARTETLKSAPEEAHRSSPPSAIVSLAEQYGQFIGTRQMTELIVDNDAGHVERLQLAGSRRSTPGAARPATSDPPRTVAIAESRRSCHRFTTCSQRYGACDCPGPQAASALDFTTQVPGWSSLTIVVQRRCRNRLPPDRHRHQRLAVVRRVRYSVFRSPDRSDSS